MKKISTGCGCLHQFHMKLKLQKKKNQHMKLYITMLLLFRNIFLIKIDMQHIHIQREYRKTDFPSPKKNSTMNCNLLYFFCFLFQQWSIKITLQNKKISYFTIFITFDKIHLLSVSSLYQFCFVFLCKKRKKTWIICNMKNYFV